MHGTHMDMPSTSLTPTPEAVHRDGAAPASAHDQLDEALVSLRRALQRPGYRRRLLEGLAQPLELGTLRLLRTVQRSDEAPSIGMVAEVLAIDPSTASRVVERAVAAGQLERRACDADRRRSRLYLTPAGIEILERVTERRRELLAEVTDGFTDAEVRTLVAGLHRVLEGFERFDAAP